MACSVDEVKHALARTNNDRKACFELLRSKFSNRDIIAAFQRYDAATFATRRQSEAIVDTVDDPLVTALRQKLRSKDTLDDFTVRGLNPLMYFHVIHFEQGFDEIVEGCISCLGLQPQVTTSLSHSTFWRETSLDAG
jgi:hypothetical protein